jgi:hypothetical protein
LTARQLAAILHPFGITPIKWRQDEATRRGYEPAHFTDAFSRYLPPVPPHPPQTSLQSTYAQTSSATKGPLMSALDDVKRSVFSAVADVADEKYTYEPNRREK